MHKPKLAIDISLTLDNNHNGIENVTKKVRTAFNNDDRFQIINAYYHKPNGMYYVIENDDDIYKKYNKFVTNIKFFFRILILIFLGTSQYRRRAKITKCFHYAMLYQNLLKVFVRFITFYSKCVNNFTPPSILQKKEVNINRLQKLDFSKIDGFFFPSFGTPFVKTILQNKKKYNFSFGVLLYDLLPIYFPQFFTNALKDDFTSYIQNCLNGADYIITDSTYVKQDVTNFIKENDYKLNPEKITAVPLATDEKTKVPASIQEQILQKYNLQKNKYATIVCTVEPRKNHNLLFDIWKKIALESPENIIPLIIVGGYGWLTEKLFTRYENDQILQKYIIFTGKVGNEERDTILQNARFSLFPSFAEGWGMPITESLQVRTPVISADNSSLLEAGHGITQTINVDDFDTWYKTVLEYIKSDEIIIQEREKIAKTKLRTWNDFNREITDVVYLECQSHKV